MVKQTQLQLIPQRRQAWQLSEETKQVGRAGLRDARRALGAAAAPSQEAQPPNDAPLAA